MHVTDARMVHGWEVCKAKPLCLDMRGRQAALMLERTCITRLFLEPYYKMQFNMAVPQILHYKSQACCLVMSFHGSVGLIPEDGLLTVKLWST